MSYNSTSQLSQDTAFDLLSSSRRRFIIRQLRSESSGIDLQTLAANLASKEADIDQAELTAQQRKRTYVSLYQTHIPKLAEVGVVRYDADAGVVYPDSKLGSLEQYLDQTADRSKWIRLHMGITVAGVLIVSVAIVLGRFRTAAIAGAIALGITAAITTIQSVNN